MASSSSAPVVAFGQSSGLARCRESQRDEETKDLMGGMVYIIRGGVKRLLEEVMEEMVVDPGSIIRLKFLP